MISQTGGMQKLGISKFWYINAMECTSSTSVLQLHLEREFMSSEWSHLAHGGQPKQHQRCHRSRWKKYQINGKKLCDKDILFSAGLMGHSVLVWKLRTCGSLINSNDWKHFKKDFYAAPFRGMWWKINRVTSRSMGKKAKILYFIVHFGDLGWCSMFQIWMKG